MQKKNSAKALFFFFKETVVTCKSLCLHGKGLNGLSCFIYGISAGRAWSFGQYQAFLSAGFADILQGTFPFGRQTGGSSAFTGYWLHYQAEAAGQGGIDHRPEAGSYQGILPFYDCGKLSAGRPGGSGGSGSRSAVAAFRLDEFRTALETLELDA